MQQSVFECTVNPAQLELLRVRLQKEIDDEVDSLRFYRLQEPRDRYVEVYGNEQEHDLHDPLVV